MTLLKLTHANHKTTVYLPSSLMAGWYTSPTDHCTYVVASGGAVFPCSESVDEVSRLYNQVAELAAISQGGTAPCRTKTKTQ